MSGQRARAVVAGVALFAAVAAVFSSCGEGSDADPRQGGDAGPPDAGVDALDAKPDTAGQPDADVGQDGGGDAITDGEQTDGLPPDQVWVTDPSRWNPIPGTDAAVSSELWEALPDKIGFPPLDWQPCGDGCETADLGQGYYNDSGWMPSATTEVYGGEARPYLQQTNTAEDTEHNHMIQRVIRLDDGKTISSIRCTYLRSGQVAQCLFARATESAMFTEIRFNLDTEEVLLLRGAVVPEARFLWALPTIRRDDWPVGLEEADIEEGRSVFIVGTGAVKAMMNPTSSEITVIESPSASNTAAGQGDLVVWTDYDEAKPKPPRVVGWTADGGVRPIIDDLPEETAEITMSPTHIVGIMGDRPDTIYATARLWATPRAYGPTEVDISTGPYLSFCPCYGTVKTWGDFAAYTMRQFQPGVGTVPTGLEIIVVLQLSTWKVWRLDPPQGYLWHEDAVTLTSTHLYAGLKLPGANEDHRLRDMRRYDLAKIDTWAQAQ